jgi:quercetin dioxygenase-like cupin family protein/ubiquinone/menaquinone biosynthesis C-methylase UbiE
MTFFTAESARKHEVAPGFVARFFHSATMTFAHWDIPKGSALPEQRHHHEQVAHILAGEFELTVDGKVHVLRTGDVAVIPSNAVHSGRAITACKIIDAFQPVREDYLQLTNGEQGTDPATSLPDYQFDPQAYEEEERSRPDEMAMIESAVNSLRQFIDKRHSTSLLDLCCGTGLPLSLIVPHEKIRTVTGLDICQEYLHFTRKLFAAVPGVSFLLGDAIDHPLPSQSYDAILLCSAYHHIEDTRKVDFLKRVRSLLSIGGRAFVAENILPPYDERDQLSYKRAVTTFYDAVLNDAVAGNPELPLRVKQLIERVAKYGCDGDYEYKVSIDTFLRDIKLAGLEVESIEKVWPRQGLLATTTGGNYALVLKVAGAQ